MNGPLPSGVLFLTVTDRNFFPGTVASVNSIHHHHPDAEVVVVDFEARGLSPTQVRLLEAGGVRVLGSGQFAAGGRYVGPWELKADAASDLARQHRLIIGIDSDCVLCLGVADVVDRALRSGRFVGGKDGDGITYDASYSVYGIAPGSRNPNYTSTCLYFARRPRRTSRSSSGGRNARIGPSITAGATIPATATRGCSTASSSSPGGPTG